MQVPEIIFSLLPARLNERIELEDYLRKRSGPSYPDHLHSEQAFSQLEGVSNKPSQNSNLLDGQKSMPNESVKSLESKIPE